MNLRKIITNTLAVVGAVVIIDKVVEMVTTKGTKAVCDALNDEDIAYDFNDSCECGCSSTDSEKTESDCKCGEDCSCNHEDAAFPDIQKYDDNNSHTFEYPIKAENITSDPKEA